ncbi:hypothetical protein GCM10009116_20160 [Brevundimonas basaltis]
MDLISEVDEVPIGESPGQLAMDRQPAHAGVEYANGHGGGVSGDIQSRPRRRLRSVQVTVSRRKAYLDDNDLN